MTSSEIDTLALRILGGKFDASPLAALAEGARGRFLEILAEQGISRRIRRPSEHAIDFGLVEILSAFIGDPDSRISTECLDGVHVS